MLINGTLVGMRCDGLDLDEAPISADRLRPSAVIIDSGYDPLETRVSRESQCACSDAIAGIEMFIAQAEGQFVRWCGCADAAHSAGTARCPMNYDRLDGAPS